MSDKDAAKRRRQARNRQERINRQKRTVGARRTEPASRPSRRSTGAAGPAAAGKDGRPSRSATAAPAPGGLLGKLFPPRPAAGSSGSDTGSGGAAARPARVAQPRESVVVEPEDVPAGARGEIARRMAQPGGRATFVAVVLALAVAVMVVVAPIAPRYAFEGYGRMVVEARPGTEAQQEDRLDAFIEGDAVALGTQRLTEVWALPVVLGFALAMLLIVGLAARSLTLPSRSRTLLITSFAAVAVMFVLGQLLLPLVAALAFASYQSRKADRLAAVQAAQDAEE